MSRPRGCVLHASVLAQGPLCEASLPACHRHFDLRCFHLVPLTISLALACAPRHSQDAAHAHGSYLWEWSGLYEFGIGTYRWQFRKNAQGLYGANDAMMRVVVLRAGAMAATSVLDNMHLAAEAVLENANCVQLAAGTELTVGDSCHELVFDAR